MLIAACGAVRARGWSPEAVFADDARGRAWLTEFEAAGVPVSFVQRGRAQVVARELAECADGAERVLFHTHFTTFDIPAALAARRAPSGRAVWHLHSHVRSEPRVKLRNVLKYLALRGHVDAILGVAPDVADTARRRGAPNVRYFPNAIDTGSMALVRPDERAAARARLGVTDEVVLLHYGWDWHRKAGDIFVETVALLRDRGHHVVGVSVGATELSDDSGVRVVPPTGELRELLAAADVFVSCSRAEGMPYSVAEALAAGVAVAATAIPGHVALCEGLSGCRLTGLDAGAIANAVEQLLARDEATVRADTMAARQRMVERHDLEPWSHELVELYERLLFGSG